MVPQHIEEEYNQWLAAGKPTDATGVPHAVKAMNLALTADLYGLRSFVETGTCHGAMVEALASEFDHIHTIEMYEPNYKIASRRLKNLRHINFHFGDSAKVLETLASQVEEPALFFLDAHYSGPGTARGDIDTPVVRELEIIGARQNPGDVVVIDDLRLFQGQAFHTDEFCDYPSVYELDALVEACFIWHEVLTGPDCFVVQPYPGEE